MSRPTEQKRVAAKTRSAGFTLIEVMLAFALGTIVIFMLNKIFHQVITANVKLSRHIETVEGVRTLRNFLEERLHGVWQVPPEHLNMTMLCGNTNEPVLDANKTISPNAYFWGMDGSQFSGDADAPDRDRLLVSSFVTQNRYQSEVWDPEDGLLYNADPFLARSSFDFSASSAPQQLSGRYNAQGDWRYSAGLLPRRLGSTTNDPAIPPDQNQPNQPGGVPTIWDETNSTQRDGQSFLGYSTIEERVKIIKFNFRYLRQSYYPVTPTNYTWADTSWDQVNALPGPGIYGLPAAIAYDLEVEHPEDPNITIDVQGIFWTRNRPITNYVAKADVDNPWINRDGTIPEGVAPGAAFTLPHVAQQEFPTGGTDINNNVNPLPDYPYNQPDFAAGRWFGGIIPEH